MSKKRQLKYAPNIGRRFSLSETGYTIVNDKPWRRLQRRHLMRTIVNPRFTQSQNGVLGHRIDAKLDQMRRERMHVDNELADNSHERKRFRAQWIADRAEKRNDDTMARARALSEARR